MLFLIFLIVCSQLSSLQGNPIIPIQIYLHIGPHKTGSTHFQRFIHHHRTTLTEQYSICLPYGYRVIAKGFSLLPLDLLMEDSSLHPYPTSSLHPRPTQRDLIIYRNHFRSCLMNQNITTFLLSAEDFSRLEITHLERIINEVFVLPPPPPPPSSSPKQLQSKSLSSTLPANHPTYQLHFKIIYFYREWLGRTFSFYTETAKIHLYQANSFSFYLFTQNFGSIKQDEKKRFNPMVTIENYQKVFNLSNIIIIDYDGMMEYIHEKDMNYIILCEIMKVFCSFYQSDAEGGKDQKQLVPLQQQGGQKGSMNRVDGEVSRQKGTAVISGQDNPHPSGYILHLVSLVRDYVHLQGYEFNMTAMPSNFCIKLVQYYIRVKLVPPIIKSDVHLLIPYAEQVDDQFTRRYRQQMLYRNDTLTKQSIHNFIATEVNTTAFAQSKRWQEFLETEKQRFLTMGILIPLKK